MFKIDPDTINKALQDLDHPADYFMSIEERLQKIDETIKESAKKNWVERNPVLFQFYSIVLSAIISAVVSITITRLSN